MEIDGSLWDGYPQRKSVCSALPAELRKMWKQDDLQWLLRLRKVSICQRIITWELAGLDLLETGGQIRKNRRNLRHAGFPGNLICSLMGLA